MIEGQPSDLSTKSKTTMYDFAGITARASNVANLLMDTLSRSYGVSRIIG